MQCNLVASGNCGNADLCHRDLLVDQLTPDAFVACIEKGVERKYEDNLASYLTRESHDDLMAVLHAFAEPFQSQGAA